MAGADTDPQTAVRQTEAAALQTQAEVRQTETELTQKIFAGKLQQSSSAAGALSSLQDAASQITSILAGLSNFELTGSTAPAQTPSQDPTNTPEATALGQIIDTRA